jgi:hypothetical protein
MRIDCRSWFARFGGLGFLALALGCGTTRMTDTQRTATEQLLVSSAVDQAVAGLDLHCLAGKSVFLDTQYLDGVVDRGYLVSSLRQQLLDAGCLLQEERARATYVVEARSGGIGTDRHSLLVGIPQTQVPAFMPGQPTQIPEIPFAKKTDQNGVAKIALFAYNRLTGQPVWQSGVLQALSTSGDLWLLGAGPFQNGSIRRHAGFAGQPLLLPTFNEEAGPTPVVASAQLTEAAAWPEGPAVASPSGPAGLVGLRDGPLTSGLLPAYLMYRAEPPAPTKAAPPAEAAPTGSPGVVLKPPTASVANTGGQAETEPTKVIASGWGGFGKDN